jgi:hypothetical protein
VASRSMHLVYAKMQNSGSLCISLCRCECRLNFPRGATKAPVRALDHDKCQELGTEAFGSLRARLHSFGVGSE